jgi:hypothetical protein
VKAGDWIFALATLPWIAPSILGFVIVANSTFFLEHYVLTGYLLSAVWIIAAIVAMVCAGKAFGKKEMNNGQKEKVEKL